MGTLPGWMITIMTAFAPAIYGTSTWHKVEREGKGHGSAIRRVHGIAQSAAHHKNQVQDRHSKKAKL